MPGTLVCFTDASLDADLQSALFVCADVQSIVSMPPCANTHYATRWLDVPQWPDAPPAQPVRLLVNLHFQLLLECQLLLQ